MNLELTIEHKNCIEILNKEGIQYLVDDTYEEKKNIFNQKIKKNCLQLILPFATSEKKQRIYYKLFKSQTSSIRTKKIAPFDRKFENLYYERIILNIDGLMIDFKKGPSLSKHLYAGAPVNVDLDYYQFRYDKFPNRRAIACLNLYQAEYLIIDHYPIPNPIGKYHSQRNMVVWVNPTEINAKKIRKANKLFGNNPRNYKEMMQNDRRFLQGGVYWQTFYKNKDFKKHFKERVIINHKGQAICFMAESLK
jgi:hypothetical protein